MQRWLAISDAQRSMINLDTNVLVRLLIADDAEQSQKARAFVATLSPARPGYVSTVVIAETMGVLARYYKRSREELAALLESLLASAELYFEQLEVLVEALAIFRRSNVGFVDCLIERLGAAAACEYTVTFDQGAAKQAGMHLLR
jgi:predicted nucleic-acid-binding protein